MTSTVVACCQLAPVVGAGPTNRELASEAIRTAVDNEASVVVLPELVSSGYRFEDKREALASAEQADGPTVSSWMRSAAAFDIVIVGGFCEVSRGQLYNSVALVDAQGLRSVYRKAHLWGIETDWFVGGDAEPPVIETRVGRIATMICYDLDFPEWVRLPALRGAQLLCAPTNWPDGPRPAGERPTEIVRVQASASVNRMFIAACDRAGHERGIEWAGASTIVDVAGWPLASAYRPGPSIPATIHAVCDLADASNKFVGSSNNVQADRRPHLYRALLED